MKSFSNRLDRLAAAGLLAFALGSTGMALAETAAKTLALRMGKHQVRVEVVQSDEERSRGLMFREKLGKNDGMLFVFDDPGYHSMWMMNTYIALSVAFVDRNGVILNIEDMEPRTTDSHTAAGPATYAIETNKGWFRERGIKPGDRVAGLPKDQPKK
jgi:uncharacterized protein